MRDPRGAWYGSFHHQMDKEVILERTAFYAAVSCPFEWNLAVIGRISFLRIGYADDVVGVP